MKQEIEALKTDIGVARIVTGTVLGILIGAIMLVTNAMAAKPAGAQEVPKIWAERTVVVEELQKQYTEIPRALGVAADGSVLELFATPDGTTWTLVVTLPNGMSRVVASGESWIDRIIPPKGRLS